MRSPKRPSLDAYTAADAARLLRQLGGREYALLAGRGAAGISGALQALGLRGAFIGIPANTCYMVLWAVLKSDNIPCLIDIDPYSGNISVEKLSAVGCRLAAVIPCHMYGLPAPMAAICAWAKMRGIPIIEDAALALGAVVDGRPAGAWGDVSIFSFGQGKVVDNALGGAALTDDPRLAAEIERALTAAPLWTEAQASLTQQWHDLYWALHQHESANPRLSTLYPALFGFYSDLVNYRLPPSYWRDLPDALRGLDANLKQRAALTALYDDLFMPRQSLPRPEGAVLWKYPLLIPAAKRDALLAHLWANGIHDATRWYPALGNMAAALVPDMPQPSIPAAEALAASIINLPLAPGVDGAYIGQVAASFDE